MFCVAGPGVPKKAELKTRVKELCDAGPNPTWEQLKKLFAPHLSECVRENEMRDSSSKTVQVISCNIASIDYDARHAGDSLEAECTGQRYKVDAAAIAKISQVAEDGADKPEREEVFQRWVLVSGTWYYSGLATANELPAGALEHCAPIGNLGLADGQGNMLHGASYHVNGGLLCVGDRFAMRNVVGFSEFRSNEDIGSQYWLAETSLYVPIVEGQSESGWLFLYGAAGVGGYYASMHPAPGGNEHDLTYGYNAGLGVNFPVFDLPGIAVEVLWHNPSGPGLESFFTVTIGISGWDW